MGSAVALLMARKELEKKIMEVGHGSDTRLHQLQTKMKILEDQVQTEHEHAESLKQHEKILEEKVTSIEIHEHKLEEELEIEAKQRKKLHNQIEEMKGAIRVFCRIRPLSSTELARGNVDITEYLSDKCTLQVYHPIENGSGGMKKGPM